MATYIRTFKKSFDELSTAQQDYARAEFDWDDNLEESSFVSDPCNEDECLHLGNFIVSSLRSCLWDGHFGQSYFSGYFIKFGRDGETCTVAYRHW